MKRFMLSGVLVLGCVVSLCAETAGSLGMDGRSAAWKQSVASAVGDATKTRALMQQIPEGDRVAFARDVLAVAKVKPTADRKRWVQDYAAVAAGLADGAGGAKRATIAAVAEAMVEIGVTGEARELTVTGEMTALFQATIERMPVTDRVAFAGNVFQAIDKQKAPDAETRNSNFKMASVALAAGAGEQKVVVVSAAFCEIPTNALGAVSAAFAEVFDQRRSKLSEPDYLQLAMRTLQAVADCATGKPDAGVRFAYAAAAFVGGAGSPATFEGALLAKLTPEILAKVGLSRDEFVAALAAAKGGIQGQRVASPLAIPLFSVQDLIPPGSVPLGLSVGGETGLPVARENRPPSPPPGYQNQGIGKKR